MPCQEVGEPIPENTAHAVSVTLPTWKAVIAYEEGDAAVTNAMKTGYPRFFIHNTIKELASKIEKRFAREGELCMVFPSYDVAKRCREFIKAKSENPSNLRRVLQLSTSPPNTENEKSSIVETTIGVVFFPADEFPLAKQYWQHSGEGILSRFSEYVLKELFGDESKDQSRVKSRLKQERQAYQIQQKSPSISASIRSKSHSENEEVERDFNTFIEQKFGRVLDLKFATGAKRALRRRICGHTGYISLADENSASPEPLTSPEPGLRGLDLLDVFLYPTGMASIFNAHRALLNVADTPLRSVCFGFPYVDTLNILRKWGPGCNFLGFGDDDSLDELEKLLEAGEKILGLFCECPLNPLLKTPNLKRIRSLADKHGFAVVVDETVGNFCNILVLPYADIVVSSLTKIFSGDSNVMGGSLILNPATPMYETLKTYFTENYEDLVFPYDALYLERNSRDFDSRSHMVNENSEAVVELLLEDPIILDVFYPSVVPSKKYYDEIKLPKAGYGGLISFMFKKPENAIKFYDAVDMHKGPSLGTNFSLMCPYALLAHYGELEEVEKWGVDRNLVRLSVGIEDREELIGVLKAALDECKK